MKGSTGSQGTSIQGQAGNAQGTTGSTGIQGSRGLQGLAIQGQAGNAQGTTGSSTGIQGSSSSGSRHCNSRSSW